MQTRPGHSNRSTVVEMRRARDEQRRVRGPPYTTDLGNVGIYVTSIPGITTSVQQIIYSGTSS